MRTYDAWFPRYALGKRLMFFCRVFSPAVGRGSFTLSTFLDRRTQRVNPLCASDFSAHLSQATEEFSQNN